MRAKILVAVLAAALPLFSAMAQEQLAHAIYVKVNGKTISQDNVLEAVRYIVKREYNGVVPEDEEVLEDIQKAALRDLIRTILIHDEAKSLSIKIDPGMSKRNQAQSGLKPEEITPTIRRMLEADDLFEDIMAQSGTPIMQPSPKEVRDFYAQHKEEFRTNAFIIVRTIFISADGSRAQAHFKDKAEAIIRELEAVPLSSRTEAFAKKAGEVSEDIFARYGGLLTADSPEKWIPKDFGNEDPEGKPIFPVQMVETIRKLNQKGELRLAVSQDGMHVMYCEDVRGGKIIGWDEASRIIDFVLKQRTKNTRMRAWINRVYDRSDVRWHDGTRFEKEALTEALLPSEKSGNM